MKEAQGGWALALAALAWLAGVGLQLQQSALQPPHVYGLAVLAAAGLGAAGLLARRWCPRLAAPCLWLAIGLAAWGSTGWRAGGRLAEALSPALEGVDLVLVGRVADLPQVDAEGARFPFEVEQARDRQGQVVPVPSRLWLAWTSGSQEDGPGLGTPPPPLAGGERWQLPVRLRRVHGMMNPEIGRAHV